VDTDQSVTFRRQISKGIYPLELRKCHIRWFQLYPAKIQFTLGGDTSETHASKREKIYVSETLDTLLHCDRRSIDKLRAHGQAAEKKKSAKAPAQSLSCCHRPISLKKHTALTFAVETRHAPARNYFAVKLRGCYPHHP